MHTTTATAQTPRTMHCPLCGPTDTPARREVVFWRAERMPVLCHGLCPTRRDAQRVGRATIELALCRHCGLVYNRAFDPNVLTYQGDYENALHFSPQFRDYADALARRLIDAHNVRGGRVLEIGCGDGQFLATLCRLGDNTGLGLDPAYDAQRSTIPPDVDVRIVPRHFDAQTVRSFPADLVCCRHVLEHLDDPMALLAPLRDALASREEAVVYFEVPNLLQTLERLAIWDVIYEHCLYFTPTTLRTLFTAAGFGVIDAGESYGGQFAWIEARVGERAARDVDEAHIERMQALAQSFESSCAERLARMRHWLGRLSSDGRRACVWGAGSKAVTMLNLLGDEASAVEAVVDQNPRKHGHYVVGTAQPIIAPRELPRLGPDAVVLMNPLYRHEVAAQLSELGLDPEIVAA